MKVTKTNEASYGWTFASAGVDAAADSADGEVTELLRAAFVLPCDLVTQQPCLVLQGHIG